MPIKINDLKILELSTGKEIIDIDDKEVVFSSETADERKLFTGDSTLTISSNTTSGFAQLVNVISDDVTLNQVIIQNKKIIGFRPARPHKKYRVHKKWLKKYGLKPIYKFTDYVANIADYSVSAAEKDMLECELRLKNIISKNILD